MNEHLISQAPLFASLPRGEIQRLAGTLRPVNVSPNTILLREGEVGDRFYIICEGQIEIVKALGTADERLVGVRGPGEYIGEMSLLDRDGLRAASARARASAQLLEMTRADFDALLNRQPTLAYEMVRVLSTRLKQAHNSAIHDL
ncbi:MAG: cyclic nucleotide-binding domain-containing protein, partial [Chloroflexota bacterium]